MTWLARARALAVIGLLALVMPLAAPPASASEGASLENKVKAAYLFNLARFTNWPALDRQSPGAPLRLCIAGSQPLAQLLAELSGRDVNGHPLRIETVGEGGANALERCQMLFIDRSWPRAASFASRLPKSQVMTVSDLPDFARRDGMIGLFNDEGRIRMEINVRLARESGLQLSAKLLEVATIIE